MWNFILSNKYIILHIVENIYILISRNERIFKYSSLAYEAFPEIREREIRMG